MKFGVSLFAQNFADWPRYLAKDFDKPQEVPDHTAVLDDLELGDMVEDLGYDMLYSVEHHFTPYELIPDALKMLTYFAGRTKRIGLASMVVVLPWHDPIRVAEQIAMLDIMLEGRPLQVGFGRGAGRVEFDSFRIPMGESRDRFREAHDVVKLALTQERFSYDGQYFKIPEMSSRPQPQSKDLVEHMYSAANSTASVLAAAKAGLGMMIIPQKEWEDYREDMLNFNAMRAEIGMAPRQPITGVFAYCAATEKEAREGAEVYMPNMSYTSLKHYESDDPDHFRAVEGYEHYAERAEAIQAGKRGQQVNQRNTGTPDQWSSGRSGEYTQTQVWGTPEMCLEKLDYIRRMTNPKEMFGMMKFGGMSLETAKKSVSLFAKEVLPELHKVPVGSPDQL